MRVLHNWLRQYIQFDLHPEALVEKLGMLGLEVENVERLGARYDGFFVGKVVEVARHPNADRLTVCSVRCGKKVHRIVCGAPNVKREQTVVIGLPGAVIPRNQHDPEGKPFELLSASIRGVQSEGMICSEYELGLGTDAAGILVLKDRGARHGTPFAKYLGLTDVAYDIEVTPNRPDWLGHIGVAREIGVITGRSARLPRVTLKESRRRAAADISIHVHDEENCKRFAVRVLKGVNIGPSPEWMQHDLKAVGLRPVNNVVDVTNYVMMETGHPLHAFDLSTLEGAEIHVRQSEREHSFATLDGRTVSIPKGAVMVCDASREVSLAGIMGGANSGISQSTRDVVIEAACWNPSSIRRTAKKTGLSTDASYRFERGTGPGGIPYVLDRAAHLIQESAGGEVLRGIVDCFPGKKPGRSVQLRNERLNGILGTNLTIAQTKALLRLLGIKQKGSGTKSMLFEIPDYRSDIQREVDLVEEVARVYGYDKIGEATESRVSIQKEAIRVGAGDRVREIMIGLGFREAITFPLVDLQVARLGGGKPVAVLNPLSAEMNSLRTSLVPGLLGSVSRNIRYGNPDVRLFEIGHVFASDDSQRPKFVEGFLEEEMLAFCQTGLAAPRHWSAGERRSDIFDIKGETESLLKRLSLDKSRFISYRTSDSLVEDAIAIEINGSRAGYLGTVRAELLKSFGIEQEVVVAELHMSSLPMGSRAQYQALPRYPRVRRDVAFVLDRASTGLLSSVEVFDLYEGDQVAEGKKSLAFSLEIVPHERTLTDGEIEGEVKRAIEAVESQLGAQLRSIPGSSY